MDLRLVGQAIGMFAVTNVDDLLLLALYFAVGAGRRGSAAGVVAGQYLGFCAILAVSVLGALGTRLLPATTVRYLGLLPLLLGLRAGWRAWRERQERPSTRTATRGRGPAGPLTVATLTFANGGDNVGVYLPVFATVGSRTMVEYVVVFLALVAVWCAAGLFLATRPVVARTLSRCGNLLLPGVLVSIGLLILARG